MRTNILKMADEIVNHRTEEKERQYGPFSEGMQRAAQIASGMTGKNIVAEDVFSVLIALKLSRHSYNYKEDNLLDACAYLGALNNYICEQTTESLPAVDTSSLDFPALERMKKVERKYHDDGSPIYHPTDDVFVGGLTNQVPSQLNNKVDLQALELPSHETLMKIAGIPCEPVEQYDGQKADCGKCKCNLCE